MLPIDINKICNQALSFFGHEAQVRQAQEECAELIVALSHLSRGRETLEEVASEIADVEIMMTQMRVVCGNNLVETAKAEKLSRLRRILEGGK
jgi:NTP pyrophosphatase (non-canonical NTP hydrolase)